MNPMNSPFERALLMALAVFSLVLPACGRTELDNQLIGQRCFQNSDCADDLTCLGRICVATGIPANNSANNDNNSTNNATNNANNTNNSNNVVDLCVDGPVTCIGDDLGVCERSAQGSEYGVIPCPDGTVCDDGACIGEDTFECPVPAFCEGETLAAICVIDDDGNIDIQVVECPDATFCQNGACVPEVRNECEPGERRCAGEQRFEICELGDDGSTFFVTRGCPIDSFCSDGECIGDCIDRDGDGFCSNVEPIDCRDDLARVFPGAEELCGNGVDDDCDGDADEGCGDCCPGGCGQGEFCRSCVCEPFDPGFCEYQNQPCDNFDSFENGFYCGDLFGTGEGRCIGVCFTNAADPDSTCPDPDSVCAFDQGNGQGICLPSCDLGLGCGDPSQGCLAFDSALGGGICVPANPNNQIGDACDPDLTFDCAGGALCIENGRPGPNGQRGVCQESCRPFAARDSGNPAQTDCNAGHCIPFSDSFGTCTQDNMFQEGEDCRPVNTTCGEDAVGCFPTQQNDRVCQRLCRLDRGNQDCNAGDTCFRIGQDDQNIGVCANLDP